MTIPGPNPLDALVNLLQHDYGVRPASLIPLLVQPDQRVYQLDRASLPPWVVRVYAGSEHTQGIFSDAAVLAFLEQEAYPAERLIQATNGSTVVVGDGLTLLVTTFVAGEPADFSPTTLRSLAETVGRLHALQPSPGVRSELRPAGMLPAGELAFALGRLSDVADRVPVVLRARYDAIEAAIRALDRCEDLPFVLIHNDCHPGNSRKTADGQVVLVDWEGAGLGPAVIDLGFLLVSGETEAFRPNRLAPDRDRVNAMVDGYRSYRQPTTRELEQLADAIRFRSLIAGAGAVAEAIKSSQSLEESPWWWARYQLSDDIARRARTRFATASRGQITARSSYVAAELGIADPPRSCRKTSES